MFRHLQDTPIITTGNHTDDTTGGDPINIISQMYLAESTTDRPTVDITIVIAPIIDIGILIHGTPMAIGRILYK